MLFVSTHDVERKNEDALATRIEKDLPLLSAVRPRFAVDGGVCRVTRPRARCDGEEPAWPTDLNAC